MSQAHVSLNIELEHILSLVLLPLTFHRVVTLIAVTIQIMDMYSYDNSSEMFMRLQALK